METYSNDNIIIVVGVQRTIEVMLEYRRLVKEVGRIMAVPEKRSLGTWMIISLSMIL